MACPLAFIEARRVPTIDEMSQWLQGLWKERRKESATACVMRVGEYQKDGGVLAMQVYGHLRDHHSASVAKSVKFHHRSGT